MKIHLLTKDELDLIKNKCDFTKEELYYFEQKSKGITGKEIIEHFYSSEYYSKNTQLKALAKITFSVNEKVNKAIKELKQ